MENLPHFVNYVESYSELDKKIIYDFGRTGCEFIYDHFLIENNPFFQLNDKKFFDFDGAVLNVDTGNMLRVDPSDTMSIPFMHDGVFVHSFHFGLLSQNYPLISPSIYNNLKLQALEFHLPSNFTAEEKKNSLFNSEFYYYRVYDTYMSSARTFFKYILPYTLANDSQFRVADAHLNGVIGNGSYDNFRNGT